jgi:hypothetical protein
MRVKNAVLVIAITFLAAGVSPSAEATVRVGVGVNIGLPIVTFRQPPALAVIPGTYAYFAPGVEADIFFSGGRWYRPWAGRWYWARAYNGPWVVAGPGFVVPAPLLHLRPGWRARVVIHERISYDRFHRHWRTWERDRYWERHHDWWRNGKLDREHERREFQRSRGRGRH